MQDETEKNKGDENLYERRRIIRAKTSSRVY